MSEFRKPYEVAILVRGSGNLELTYRCLASIVANTPAPSYRLFYVDNGSPVGMASPAPQPWDGAADLMRVFRDAVFVRLPFNHGSVYAINAGLQLAMLDEPKYALLMDNDTEIPVGDVHWLERWVAWFEGDVDNVGAVGATSNYVSFAQNADMVNQDPYDTYQRDWKVEGQGEGFKLPMQVPVLVSFAMMLRAQAVRETGLFDTRYEPGNLEDYDYIVAMREKGWVALIAEDVWIHHKGSQTFRENLPELMAVNTQKFIEKWGQEKLAQMGVVLQ